MKFRTKASIAITRKQIKLLFKSILFLDALPTLNKYSSYSTPSWTPFSVPNSKAVDYTNKRCFFCDALFNIF